MMVACCDLLQWKGTASSVVCYISSDLGDGHSQPPLAIELEPLDPGEWDALYGLQSLISSGFSDDFRNLQGLSGMNSLVKKLDTLFLLNVNSSHKLIRDGSDEDAETIAALLNEFSSMANEEY
ncbi:hypothetical protein LWI28_006706 [Acer negundo]|uniref:Uncharacterized protein n=1 Tax=Acer negundo TaxID=4023 RepID=A0AAD5JCD7_ACENE|nr:hypothetical protein LWI28_006706 [Acer negundo]